MQQRRQEGVLAAPVRHARAPALPDAERQLAFAAGAVGLAHVRQDELLAVGVIGQAGPQRPERHRIGGPAARHRHRDLSGRLGQPAVRAIVKQCVPLVPKTGVVAQLDAADHGERAALVAPAGADLHACVVFEHGGHLADVLERLAVAQQRALAEAAHRHHGGGRLQFYRRATRRAVGMKHDQRVSESTGRPGRLLAPPGRTIRFTPFSPRRRSAP